MSDQVASIMERLADAKAPNRLSRWPAGDHDYVTACRISAADIPSLIEVARKWSDLDWPGESSPEGTELLAVTAWRTLAELKAADAAEPLAAMLCELDECDDWVAEELPQVFGKIGEASIEPLKQIATSPNHLEFIRSVAIRGLRYVVEYSPDTRPSIVPFLTNLMAAASPEYVDVNTTLLTELVDLHVTEAAEPIERAFANDQIDVGMMGTWEVVRQRLGVQGLGLLMPVNPQNSLEDFRHSFGMGVFSESPVFDFDDIRGVAENKYYSRVVQVFSPSSEAAAVISRHGELGWIPLLLEFGIQYRGEIVDLMTVASVEEFVLDFVPRKVSTNADAAESILDELIAFWAFLHRVYQFPNAPSILEWLNSDARVRELQNALNDPSNFGMAKSMMMLGKNAGYDMTTERGVNSFTQAYNRSVTNTLSDNSTAARKQRIGRNEPCPCGSGKKYKKCCGAS